MKTKTYHRTDPSGQRPHDLADFLLSVRLGQKDRLVGEYAAQSASLPIMHKAAMSGSSGTLGGYTIPQELHPEVFISPFRPIVRPRASVFPQHGRSLQVPVLDVVTAQSSGDTTFFGSIVGRWAEEGSTLNETEPLFRQLELVAHELSGFSLLSRSLYQDGEHGALEVYLHKAFTRAVSWYEDQAFLIGSGAGRPLGVANAPCAISVSRKTAGQFVLEDAGVMLGKLPPCWNPLTTCFVVHPSVLKFAVQQTASVFGAGLTAVEGRWELLGVPVEVFDGLSAIGTAKDVILADFSWYGIGDRGEIDVAYSEHFPAAYQRNQGVFRFVDRVDGQPVINNTITLSDATTTASPFVYLT
jgi:HK97 family phage major capsid protein